MIFLEITIPNGAKPTYHAISKIEVVKPFNNLSINVLSFASAEAAEGGTQVMWSTPVNMPIGPLSGDLLSIVETWLITNTDSPFIGGIIIDQSVPVDPRSLESVISGSILAVDAFADKARLSVVGDAARIEEYRIAQQHAQAYQASNWMLEPIPSAVESWATAKNWTAQRAAEDILAASTRWYSALDDIRALRLKAKEDIRAATTNTEADTILATFKDTLTAAMQGVV